nr:hypothetical protein [Bacteroidota bacterium]
MRIVIHYLENIDGVAIFPIIGLFIFFSFFLLLLYYVFHLDKEFIRDMGNTPINSDLDNNESSNFNIKSRHGKQ